MNKKVNNAVLSCNTYQHMPTSVKENTVRKPVYAKDEIPRRI